MGTDKWLALDELAEYLKLSRTKLYRMAQEGKILGSKIGSQWRSDREAMPGENPEAGWSRPSGQ